MNKQKTLYVGLRPFNFKQEALDYCNKQGLSPTVIHHRPLKNTPGAG